MNVLTNRSAAIASLVMCVAANGLAQAPSFPAAAVDSAVPKLLGAQRVPSAVVEVVRGTHVIYAHAFGLRDVARGLPADLNTRYEVGSMTKQFTAAAILQLQEAGKLSIDDKVVHFLPHAPHASEITIRQLLDMRSGLVSYNEIPGFHNHLAEPGGYDAVVALVKKQALHFAPGSDFEYSNTNYIILGRIVEVLSRQSYGAYVHEHEWSPAGMTHTSTIASESKIQDMAVGYSASREPATLPEGWSWAAGDMVSTAADMMRWSQALSGGRIISAGDFALMTQASQATRESKSADSRVYYGFGLEIKPIDGVVAIEHGGSTLRFQTYCAYFPRQNVRIVVLANSAQAVPDEIAENVFDLMEPGIAAAYTRNLDVTVHSAQDPDPNRTARLRAIFAGAMKGQIDRSQLTPNASKQLSNAQLRNLSSQATALGEMSSFTYKATHMAGNDTSYLYIARYSMGTFIVTFTIDAENRISDFDISPGS